MTLNSNYRILLVFLLLSSSALAQNKYSFNLGTVKPSSSSIAISKNVLYSEQKGYGFLSIDSLFTGGDTLSAKIGDSYIGSHKPFFFSVKIPEGNYNVTITYGDRKGSSSQIVRAECRRLMTNLLTSQYGEVKKVVFTVNVRTPRIGNTGKNIALKPREHDYLHWDDQLTLEFNGDSRICGIQIEPAKAPVTIFLAGNSTVVDQPSEPFTSWGQLLPVFLVSEKVVVANFAESGLSLRSFESSHRLDKVLSLVRKGDYILIEFGHNDQKEKGEGVGPYTTYKASLEKFIIEAKKRGANPILITPMQRRSFDGEGKLINTLGDYPNAMRLVAREYKVPLIDLNAMTTTLYESLGVDSSLNLFVHYPANTFPDQKSVLADNTHTRAYGAYEIARCIVFAIQRNAISLKKYLKTDIPAFSPDTPDSFDSFYWPLSPLHFTQKPDGN